MIEKFFTCPYCFEEISVLIDPSVSRQHYVEDCEVCCNPISVNVEVKNGAVENFFAENLGQ